MKGCFKDGVKFVGNTGKLALGAGKILSYLAKNPKATADDIYNVLKESKSVLKALGPKGSLQLAKEIGAEFANQLGKKAKESAIKFAKEFKEADIERRSEMIAEFFEELCAAKIAAIGASKTIKGC